RDRNVTGVQTCALPISRLLSAMLPLYWGEHQYNGNIAVSSLASLAFMAGGHQPGRGHYGKNVEKAIEYVLSKEAAHPPGFLFYSGAGTGFGAMYSHGFGTLLLGEAYGMVSNKDMQRKVRGRLERDVGLIVKDQKQVKGSWRCNTTHAKWCAQDASVERT